MITHLVFFWTDKPHGETRERVLAEARKLEAIPGVRHFRAGIAMPSPRGAVDDSFAVGLAMDFDDRAGLDAYQTHPLHVAFVNDTLKPLVRRFVVYDIET